MATVKEAELAVQINGKIRDRIVVPADAGEQEIEQKALANPKVQATLNGQKPKKVIIVKSRLVNLIV
jgi:leucyl-tRNA synthetase